MLSRYLTDPQTCLIDGIQIATGATYGKSLIEKTFLGKLAAVFYSPKGGAVRIALRPEFSDEFGKHEFFAYRKRGMEPSEISDSVTYGAIKWMYEQADEMVFKIEKLQDYKFTPPKGSFSKTKCTKCGEYVFERYVRFNDDKPYCIPCSGYGR